MTILIAEDSRFMRHAMERMLTKEGYKVLIAEDGEQALRVAQETLPELILLDMMLPKLSGLEVLEALKRLSSTQQIPVIVLTSLSEKNESKLLQAGAAAYLVKSDKLLEDNARTLRQLIQTLRPSCCDMLEFSLFSSIFAQLYTGITLVGLLRLSYNYFGKKSETITIESPLTIEHILPQTSVENWP